MSLLVGAAPLRQLQGLPIRLFHDPIFVVSIGGLAGCKKHEARDSDNSNDPRPDAHGPADRLFATRVCDWWKRVFRPTPTGADNDSQLTLSVDSRVWHLHPCQGTRYSVARPAVASSLPMLLMSCRYGFARSEWRQTNRHQHQHQHRNRLSMAVLATVRS